MVENAEERTVASVYKHKLSKNWWGRAYRNGKEIRVSLRTTSKVEANKRLAQWIYDLDNGSYQTGCNYTYDQLAELFITEYIPTLKEQRRYVTSLRMLTPYFKGKKLDEIYKLAWNRGLKTTYYLRTIGATHAEKSTTNSGELNSVQTIEKSSAPLCTINDPDCEACQ